jgi:hypothetical protein
MLWVNYNGAVGPIGGYEGNVTLVKPVLQWIAHTDHQRRLTRCQGRGRSASFSGAAGLGPHPDQ